MGISQNFKKFIHKIFLLLLGILVAAALILNLILFIPSFIFRPIAILFSKCFRTDLGDIVSSMGNVFAQVDTKDITKTVIVAQVKFEGVVDYEDCLKSFKDKIISCRLPNGKLRYPQMQQSIVNWAGYKFWKWEERFDLKDHIKIKVADGDLLTSQGIHRYSKSLLNHKFPDDKSPWDLILILPKDSHCTKIGSKISLKEETSSNPEVSTIGFLRFHHALADGYSMLNLCKRLLNTQKEFTMQPLKIKPKFASHNFNYYFALPYKLFLFLGQLACNTASSFLWKIPEEKKSLESNFRIGEAINVDKIMEIKNHHGVNFSSVIFALITGGIRNFLVQKGSSVPETLPSMLALPMKNHPDRLENKFSFGLLDYPIGEIDPVKALKLIDEEFSALRGSALPLIGYYVGRLHGLNFNFMGRILNSLKYSPLVTTYLPLVGNDSHFQFNGNKISQLNFFIRFHQGQLGGTFCVSSFEDSINITPVFNAALMSQQDVDRLASLIHSQLGVLTKTIR